MRLFDSEPVCRGDPFPYRGDSDGPSDPDYRRDPHGRMDGHSRCHPLLEEPGRAACDPEGSSCGGICRNQRHCIHSSDSGGIYGSHGRHHWDGIRFLRAIPCPVGAVSGGLSQSILRGNGKRHGRPCCPQHADHFSSGACRGIRSDDRSVSPHRCRCADRGTAGFCILLLDEHAPFRRYHRGSGRLFSVSV